MPTNSHKQITLVLGFLLLMPTGASAQSVDVDFTRPGFRLQIAPRVFLCTLVAANGRVILGDLFLPTAPGKRPAVLVLHGGMGVRLRAPAYYHYAEDLAAHGYVAFVPHWSEAASDQELDTMSDQQANELGRATIEKAIDFVQDLPEVQRDRIGLVGFSWGAGLAVAQAARDPRIKMVIDYYGFGRSVASSFPEPQRLPPTLILHGDRDENVKVEDARQLDSLLTRLKVPHETKIYPGYAHLFDAQHPADAWKRTLDFLNRYLQLELGKRSASERGKSN